MTMNKTLAQQVGELHGKMEALEKAVDRNGEDIRRLIIRNGNGRRTLLFAVLLAALAGGSGGEAVSRLLPLVLG